MLGQDGGWVVRESSQDKAHLVRAPGLTLQGPKPRSQGQLQSDWWAFRSPAAQGCAGGHCRCWAQVSWSCPVLPALPGPASGLHSRVAWP